MTPVLLNPIRTPLVASSALILAANIVRQAAETLAEESSETADVARYLLAADRLTTVLDSPQVGRVRLLLSSPALTDQSGRNQTLIEMIASDPGDDVQRLRLAKILFRALLWRPETFPIPAV